MSEKTTTWSDIWNSFAETASSFDKTVSSFDKTSEVYQEINNKLDNYLKTLEWRKLNSLLKKSNFNDSKKVKKAEPETEKKVKEKIEINTQKIEDLDEKTKAEKLKKMTKSPENYFRWSIEEYQAQLLEYNKDPNLIKLATIKVPTHWDLHIEQLVFKWKTPLLSDFDESYSNWTATNDLIRILSSIKTWWWDETIQKSFLDIYLKSLKWEKVELTQPWDLSSFLKSDETQNDLSNWKNWFVNFKDSKFQDWIDKKTNKTKPIEHIKEEDKSKVKSILNKNWINWEVLDWRVESSNWVWSFWMKKIVVAVKNWSEVKFYEFKQQSSIHTAKNLDWKIHKNNQRQKVATILWTDIKVTNIDNRDYTITEITPNYNKFPPDKYDLAKNKYWLNYWASCIALELAKLHKSKSSKISNLLNQSTQTSLIEKANDFNEKNKSSFDLKQKETKS